VKIHSSSVAYYPAGINQSQSAKSSNANNDTHKLNTVKKDKQALSQSNKVVLTTEQFGKELDQLEPFNIPNSVQKFIDMRTQKALTAYIDSANQPQHEQRSQLTNIDFYI